MFKNKNLKIIGDLNDSLSEHSEIIDEKDAKIAELNGKIRRQRRELKLLNWRYRERSRIAELYTYLIEGKLDAPKVVVLSDHEAERYERWKRWGKDYLPNDTFVSVDNPGPTQ